jgi:EAL domain-containing protein (putative c-di-GMP-specific phosphodiesterase class I)
VDQRASGQRPGAAGGRPVVASLSRELPELLRRFQDDGALGLVVIDGSALLVIERIYGSAAFRRALGALVDRVRRFASEARTDFRLSADRMTEEQILLFLCRPRSDAAFYSEVLPRLADELRGFVAHAVPRVVYPYLTGASELPVGHATGLFRSYQRPEVQVHSLIRAAQATAGYARERIRRERADQLQRIILLESLTTVYEPIVRLSDRRVLGYEALARGPLGSGLERPPLLFSIAADCDREYELDNLCRKLALSNARGIRPHEKLFLNVLPTSLHDPNFSEVRVRALLDRLGLTPHNLVLEISERQAILNFPIFREAIDHFSKLGFGIALDDTGAGYSSLEAALELSPHYLKIDMSLVRNVDQQAPKQELLRGLQALSERMKASLIAEGIESEEELATLRSLGIAYGQGFAIGRGCTLGGGSS